MLPPSLHKLATLIPLIQVGQPVPPIIDQHVRWRETPPWRSGNILYSAGGNQYDMLLSEREGLLNNFLILAGGSYESLITFFDSLQTYYSSQFGAAREPRNYQDELRNTPLPSDGLPDDRAFVLRVQSWRTDTVSTQLYLTKQWPGALLATLRVERP